MRTAAASLIRLNNEIASYFFGLEGRDGFPQRFLDGDRESNSPQKNFETRAFRGHNVRSLCRIPNSNSAIGTFT